MIARIASALSPRLAGALALLLSLSMAILGWFGYRAMREWQLSAALLTFPPASTAAQSFNYTAPASVQTVTCTFTLSDYKEEEEEREYR